MRFHPALVLMLVATAQLLLACHKTSDDPAAGDASGSPSVDPSAWMAMAMADRPPASDAERAPDPPPTASISIVDTPRKPPPPDLDAPLFDDDGSLPADFSLSISDSECFGHCPSFNIQIDGRGNVTMNATAYEKAPGYGQIDGCANKSIGVAGVKAILKRMTAQGLFSSSWPDSSNPFDRPTDRVHEEIQLQMKGRSKNVDHNTGSHWPAKYTSRLDAIRGPIEQMAGVTAFMAHPRPHSCP